MSFDCTRTDVPESPLSTSTLASLRPSGLITSRTAVTDADFPLMGTCQDVPPSKSMPRLRPRVKIAIRAMRITVPERIAHRHARPVKSKSVRSW
jgi:hypothetical protein